MSVDATPIAGHTLDLRTQVTEDCVVVECCGRLTFETSALLKAEVRPRIPQSKRIVLDLKEVPMLDSFGVGTIVGLYISARTRGCRLEIVNANKAIRQLLAISNLLSLFEPVGRCGKIP